MTTIQRPALSHEPLPSVVSQFDGLSAQHLGRGVAPGGYDTCYPGCPDCEKLA